MTMSRTRLIATCLLTGFIGGAFSHWLVPRLFSEARATDPRILTAQGFNLVDGTGRLRAQLSFSKEGPPGLFLLDEQGRARAVLAVYPDGTGHLVFNDRSGAANQILRSFGPAEAPLHIFKHGGQDEMILGLNPAGGKPEPFLMRYEAGRKRKTEFGVYQGP